MNSDLVIAMMGLLGVVCVLFVFAMVFGKQPPKSTSQATVKPQAQTMSEPSPMQLAIHRDNKSYWRNKALLWWGSSGCLVAILIGVVVLWMALLVALILTGQAIGQAIDGFFEEVRDFFEHPLNPFSWF
ncbi:MAG: hypothetical protein CMJ79_04120 [Planctomycetaceae bacterium]|nr:hypothetical protein [Planctomycetaceae bacterium]